MWHLKKLSLVLLLIFSFSCQNYGPEQPADSPTGELKFSTTSFKTHQMVGVVVKNTTLREGETYSGKIGALDIEAYYSSDTTVVFVVPGNAPTGTQNLSFAFAKNSVAVSITQTKVPADPTAHIDNYISTLENNIKEQKEEGIMTDTEAVSYLADINTQKQQLVSMTGENKAALAGFLVANNEIIEKLNQLIADTNSGGRMKSEEEFTQLTQKLKKLFKELVIVSVGITTAYGASRIPIPIVAVTGYVVGAILILTKLKPLLQKIHNTIVILIDKAIKPVNVELGLSGGRTKSLNEFASGTPQGIATYIVKNNVQPSDKSLNLPVVTALINAIDDLISFWKTFFQPLGGRSLAYPSLRRESFPATSATGFTIEVVGNTAVTGIITYTDGFYLTFTSSNSSSDQSFSYRIKFTDGLFTVSSSVVEATVKANAYTLKLISGNDQSVKVNEDSQPLKVQVVDSEQKPVANHEVEWKVASGGGTLTSAQNNTDAAGFASNAYKAGNAPATAKVEASSKQGGTVMVGSPIAFTVTVTAPKLGCNGVTNIVDPRDGQVYNVVEIGSQCWFAQNLRYAGGIAQVANAQQWEAIWNHGNPTGQPAWTWYDNNPGYDATYGKLYNWYAVNTGVCPSGWHVPTDAEWTVLTNFLGSNSGGKMKSVAGWNPPNGGATNESGFTALPGGARYLDGSFDWVGYAGNWWSSPANWGRGLGYSTGDVSRFNIIDGEALGLSVRCLRD